MLLAPATANVLAKLAHGLADEIVTTTVLASSAPLVVAPAMHTRMWEQPATQENIATLRERGVVLAGPVEGRLASGEEGMGRLAGVDEVLRAVRDALPGERELGGVTVVVTAGGTREPLDPVRFIGNHSSGLMGHALAAAAEARGADVVLVTTAALPEPDGVSVVRVETAAEMAAALGAALPAAQVLVMAAAVADFRPRARADVKLAKADMPDSLELEHNEDILATLGAGSLVTVGFAAETHDVLAHAQQKLVSKGIDLIVANDVSDPLIGMGSADNAVSIIGRDGTRTDFERAPKEQIADRVLDAAIAVLRGGEDAGPGRTEAVS